MKNLKSGKFFLIHFLIPIFMVFSVSSYAYKLNNNDEAIKTGADRIMEWLPMVEEKNIALLVNHTAVIDNTHLVDTLIALDINIVRIFVPEHGFRGDADAGELIEDEIDPLTLIPISSLYGNMRKPSKDQLQNIDVVIFDIQDVGVRFYTYISTMHYMMEACAEVEIPMIILDRPNPNGDYFDGPVLKTDFSSFVGMHPIPVVHGLTVGELALMINGEGWLKNALQCELKIINIKNYSKNAHYSVTLPPSPNLPNDLAIRLYPSLCFFEATNISIGRGTYFPFQVLGYPKATFGSFTFTPVSIKGMSMEPPQQDKVCYGIDLRQLNPWEQRFTLKYFMQFYHLWDDKTEFVARRQWFNLLAGTDLLLKQIESGMSEEDIRASWKQEHEEYARMCLPYLLYDKNMFDLR